MMLVTCVLSIRSISTARPSITTAWIQLCSRVRSRKGKALLASLTGSFASVLEILQKG